MHRKQSILIWLTLLVPLAACPQQPLNTNTTDEQTYTLYINQDWDGLIELGQEALAMGIDFYYLHVRIGIAWYEKKNYHKALGHFNKAHSINQDDPYLLEYLYYTNLFLLRRQEARLVARRMTPRQRRELGIRDDMWVESVEVSFQGNQAHDATDVNGFFESGSVNATDGSQFISTGHRFVGLYMVHPVSPKLSIYHGFAHMRKEHAVFSRVNNQTFTNENTYSNLKQYYISGVTRITRSLMLITSFHAINIRYPVETTITRGVNTMVVSSMESLTDFAGCLSLYAHIGNITLGGSIHAAGLNNKRQVQGDGTIAWYPLGNMNLYAVSVVSFQSESALTENRNNRQVVFQRIGLRVANPLWVEGYASLGEMQNFLRSDALVVYNSMNAINRQLGAKMIFQLTQHIHTSFSYTFAQHESLFIPEAPGMQPTNALPYNSHSLNAGLVWTF